MEIETNRPQKNDMVCDAQISVVVPSKWKEKFAQIAAQRYVRPSIIYKEAFRLYFELLNKKEG